jgi:hypothetical protein
MDALKCDKCGDELAEDEGPLFLQKDGRWLCLACDPIINADTEERGHA